MLAIATPAKAHVTLLETRELDALPKVPYRPLAEASSAVGLLIPADALQRDGAGGYYLATDRIAAIPAPWCEQPRVAISRPATFLHVGHGLLVGAAHSLPDFAAGRWLVVFNLHAHQHRPARNGANPTYFVAREDVFRLCAIVSKISGEAGDAIILRCESYAGGAPLPPALPLASAHLVANGDLVAMIGHPFGLPLKSVVPLPDHLERAPRAWGLKGPYLRTSVDSHRGNSGSPIFNMAGEVIAIQNFCESSSTEPNGANPQKCSRATIVDTLAEDLLEFSISVRTRY